MKYGLIGEKLTHSFSKIVHEKLADYTYELKELKKEELDSFFIKKEFTAINVTIPYKREVIKYLDGIDDGARFIGVVNTIVNKDGKLYGYNTDYLGLIALIKKSGISLCGKKVLILGSGATSKTAFCAAESMGACKILRVSRSKCEDTVTYSEVLQNHLDADIIINTTPVGMYPNTLETPIDIERFSNLCGVIDVIYNPLKTRLIVDAENKGIQAVSGLYMLVAQAVFAVEKFLDIDIDESQIDTIYNDILKEKQNIVLIGMPTSGKTSVGKILADKLSKKFVDTDVLIEENEKLSIPEIFESYGEDYFRQTESSVIEEVSKQQGLIIATGGGAILREENIKNLRKNGLIFFLDRSLQNLITTDNRPLSSNRENLIKRYNERYDLYRLSADFIIKADGSVEDNANLIKEGFLNENTCN